MHTKSVDWKGMIWHQSCFLCYECKELVTTKPFFYEKYRTLMCAKCCKKFVISNFNCNGCGKKVLVDEQTVAVDMEPYHKKCFRCSFCSAELDLNNYERKGNRLQCNPCKLKSAVRCKECSKPILAGMVKFDGSNYHRKCLRCEDCGKHVQERIVRENSALQCRKCHNGNGPRKILKRSEENS
ncbi:four and a half LIM domains protein 5-like [Brevipalpus obovatus]|uniref:four and a half LIM domains protein 5-like n=1 Tax=Brevipalpus obovatus TaxID=246614 RepID=UPI003D9DFED9